MSLSITIGRREIEKKNVGVDYYKIKMAFSLKVIATCNSQSEPTLVGLVNVHLSK